MNVDLEESSVTLIITAQELSEAGWSLTVCVLRV